MFKVKLLFVAYLLGMQNFSVETTTITDLEATTTTNLETTTSSGDECLYENELWPSVDATKFYFCLPDSKTPVESSCSSRTLFVKNEEISGCVPLAAVPENCVYHDVIEACTGDNLWQPQRAQYPTKYYLCPGEGAEIIQLTCPPGKAFVHEQGYLGCFPWEEWRKIRGCTLWE